MVFYHILVSVSRTFGDYCIFFMQDIPSYRWMIFVLYRKALAVVGHSEIYGGGGEILQGGEKFSIVSIYSYISTYI